MFTPSRCSEAQDIAEENANCLEVDNRTETGMLARQGKARQGKARQGKEQGSMLEKLSDPANIYTSKPNQHALKLIESLLQHEAHASAL
ncbi:hypothetical protein [Teichococcus deserti]|uniref:hypothetical protein n=1 Tax=Teichococcus deserti TaxID=1817963 RepID=UPI0010554B25|nr:hypothetical protein [Pseudoroseomonas deserti]